MDTHKEICFTVEKFEPVFCSAYFVFFHIILLYEIDISFLNV